MGIGNIPYAGYTCPALTSIRMPRYEMGMRAVKLILQKELDGSYSLFLETELVVRGFRQAALAGPVERILVSWAMPPYPIPNRVQAFPPKMRSL
ncbi:MAG: hypothetical protein MZV63_07365 [Marinilabiliales bacterium]|nr:hypothetical protein [Marinilabiliales bacterium]